MYRLQPPPQNVRSFEAYYPAIWDLFRNISWMLPAVSDDNGDASAIINAGQGVAMTQIWNTPLTAARTVTIGTNGVPNGAKLRIVRGNGATGAFNLTIDPTGINKVLNAAGQWCDVECNASGVWIETASGSL